LPPRVGPVDIVAAMVRRDSKSQLVMPFMSEEEDCCAEPTGESPVPVSVGAPGSRPPGTGEIQSSEARCQKPREWEQSHGPQHQANAAASSDKQWGSRAAHVTAKAMSTAPDPKREVGSPGVRAVARVKGSVRNTGDPSAQPKSGPDGSNKPKVKSSVAQRKSEEAIVPMTPVQHNAGPGKDLYGDDVGREATCEGMAGHKNWSNHPIAPSGDAKVRYLQRRLWAAAKRSPERRFHALYDRICRDDVLWTAWERVRANRGAAGIDKQTLADIEQTGIGDVLAEIQADLETGTYRPSAVRRQYIPKSDGTRRPLGIPTVRDRIVQTAAKLVLEPVFEADFLPCSFGFRPKRSATDALECLRERAYRDRDGNFVLDADIRAYFDSIDQSKLMELVGQRISDRRMLKLLRQWLQAGVMEEGEVRRTSTGTPQGGVISPLLANIYLHALDERWNREHAHLGTLVRYADDFVVMCDTAEACEQARRVVGEILDDLGLELHPDKTRMVELTEGKEGFDFLGCHLRKRMSGRWWEKYGKRRYYLQRWPSARAMKSVRQRVKELTSTQWNWVKDVRILIQMLNPILRGWGNYFRTGNAAKKFNQLDSYVWRRLCRFQMKRKGRHLKAGEAEQWTRKFFWRLGLHRLKGTVQYPETA
jgi:RNA-directed DNA polymerase